MMLAYGIILMLAGLALMWYDSRRQRLPAIDPRRNTELGVLVRSPIGSARFNSRSDLAPPSEIDVSFDLIRQTGHFHISGYVDDNVNAFASHCIRELTLAMQSAKSLEASKIVGLHDAVSASSSLAFSRCTPRAPMIEARPASPILPPRISPRGSSYPDDFA